MNRLKKNKKLLIIAIVFAIIIITVLDIVISKQGNKGQSAKVAKGREFVEKQESANMKAVEKSINKCTKEHLNNMDNFEKMKDGNAQVWSLFADTLIMGDSRVVGFDVFKCLPSNQVIADPGKTINAISEETDTIKAQNPSKIILSYGVNDMKLGIWKDRDDYVKDYAKQIKKLKKAVPNAEIYVNSILPVQNQAIENCSVWGEIPEYNKALKKMCKKNHVGFIDCTSIVKDEYFEGDGVHLKSPFYPSWGIEMAIQSISAKEGK